MSEGPRGTGRVADLLRGLRERLREPRHYTWPQYLTEGFGVDSQPASVECVCGEINARNCPVHGGDPICEHPECSEPFWEDGDDSCPACGAPGPLESTGDGYHFNHACDPYAAAARARAQRRRQSSGRSCQPA